MKIVDLRGNPLQEGDAVALQVGERQCLGRVDKLDPILDRGPYGGGVHVVISVQVTFPVPPGHPEIPVFLTVDPIVKPNKDTMLVVSEA